MISAQLENITPYSHPALHIVADEMRLRGRLTSNRFRRRLLTWTIAEQERKRQSQILDMLRLHGRLAANGGSIHG
jgi:hypothetical protein